VDEVAYVRFASVFNRYESVDEFLMELKRISSTKTDAPTS
jgi:transcriptional regulator NrdR family protein